MCCHSTLSAQALRASWFCVELLNGQHQHMRGTNCTDLSLPRQLLMVLQCEHSLNTFNVPMIGKVYTPASM